MVAAASALVAGLFAGCWLTSAAAAWALCRQRHPATLLDIVMCFVGGPGSLSTLLELNKDKDINTDVIAEMIGECEILPDKLTSIDDRLEAFLTPPDLFLYKTGNWHLVEPEIRIDARKWAARIYFSELGVVFPTAHAALVRHRKAQHEQQ